MPLDYIERVAASLPPSASVGASQLAKPDELSWRDYLLMLLRIDAGIEHGLMVQYLYAAYSLGGAQVPPEHRQRVRQWQQSILSIAKEEMGHLLTVQNVICCLGGTTCLEREDYPWDSPFYPFPFELEPLSLDTLAKYVYTEAPVNWGKGRQNSPPDAAERAEIEARLQRRPVPPRPDVKPVPALFAVILEILRNPELIPDDAFNPDTFSQQASWAAWARNHGAPSGQAAGDGMDPASGAPARTCPTTADVIVVQVGSRDDVIDALLQVAHQGEAPESAHETSHFKRFLEIYREFGQYFPDSKGGLKPTRPLPVNPTTFAYRRPVSGDSAGRNTLISHPVSAKWASLFDLRYRLLLTGLAHSYRIARLAPNPSGPGTYQALVHHTFMEMYNLKALADILVHQPLNKGGSAAKAPAGPPFQLPYTLELPENPVSCWLQYREMVAACRELERWLLDPANAALADGERQYLLALANADDNFDAWLDAVLQSARDLGSLAQ